MHRFVLPLSLILTIIIHSLLFFKFFRLSPYSKETIKVNIIVNSKSIKKEVKRTQPIKKSTNQISSQKVKSSIQSKSSKAYSRYKITPQYSYLSKLNEEEGSTKVLVHIDETGFPKNLEIIKSSGYKRLDAEALRSIRSASFIPATQNNINKEDKIEITIQFNLIE